MADLHETTIRDRPALIAMFKRSDWSGPLTDDVTKASSIIVRYTDDEGGVEYLVAGDGANEEGPTDA